MAQFRRGQRVNIPCNVQNGAFPDEVLVTIETDKGVVSGFLKSSFLVRHEGCDYVPGVVIEAGADSVKVRVQGSFFTTAAGLTTVSSGWAQKGSPGSGVIFDSAEKPSYDFFRFFGGLGR